MEVKYKTGITFGAFDPLHIGHIFLIENALKHCETLIVGVSSDNYIRENKNYEPRFSMYQRIQALEMIKGIDKIVVQDTKECKKIIVNALTPDVIFVGNDWTPETFTGEGLGIPVIYLPRTAGVSATKLRENETDF